MKMPRTRLGGIFASVVLIGLAGWWLGWFSEPVYRGRTVTGWLDHMKVFEGERDFDSSGASGFKEPSLVGLENDLRPFRAMGSNAVPVLIKRLTEPPQWALKVGPIGQVTGWFHWKWNELNGAKPTPFPPTLAYPSSFQMARQDAAALALLGLGTNAGAGLPSLLDAVIASSVSKGKNRRLSSISISIARSLPDRREEIIFGVNLALRHTNAEIRGPMANTTRIFPEQLPLWKGRLLELTKDKVESVRIYALRALVITAPPDRNILKLAEGILQESSLSYHERAFAAGIIGQYGSSASNSLPLLRAAANQTNFELRDVAQQAIYEIERKVNSGKAAFAE